MDTPPPPAWEKPVSPGQGGPPPVHAPGVVLGLLVSSAQTTETAKMKWGFSNHGDGWKLSRYLGRREADRAEMAGEAVAQAIIPAAGRVAGAQDPYGR